MSGMYSRKPSIPKIKSGKTTKPFQSKRELGNAQSGVDKAVGDVYPVTKRKE